MRFILLFLAFISFVFCVPEPRKVFGPTSYEEPTALPVDLHLLSQAAGMAHEPYCHFNDEGKTVGDAEIVWTKWIGLAVQRAKIFHSKSLGVTVSFEGTTASILSILHDVNLALRDPPKELNDAYDEGSQLLSGFVDAYMDVRDDTYAEIVKCMQKYNDTRVTVTGHSLGAAMTALAAMDLEHRLEHGIYKAFAFAMPRTGNAKFASSVDNRIGGRFFYIANGRDWVPHMPPRDWGFQHPSGQVWINPVNSDNWKFYPGQENHFGANTVDPIWTFDDHHGYYFGTGVGHGPGTCPASVGTHTY